MLKRERDTEKRDIYAEERERELLNLIHEILFIWLKVI